MRSYKVRNYNCSVRTTYTEECDLFPRNQHPDQRSNKEWLIVMGFAKNHSKNKYNIGVGKSLICVTNGKSYKSQREAAIDLKIDPKTVAVYLRGKSRKPKYIFEIR